jgi:undecaprenyl-diphosphatase
VTALLGVLAIVLIGDALVRARGGFDYEIMRTIRRLDFAGLETALRLVSDLTSSAPAIALWALALVAFMTLRRWLAAVALLAFPVAGGLNWGIRWLVGRSRPDSDILTGDFFEPVPDDFASFPSGHVVGAVLLYGFLFFLAGGIHSRLLRWPVRAVCAAIIVLAGFARVWLGAHWFGDVAAGYVLGGLVLMGVVAAYSAMAPTFAGIPLVRAAPVPLPRPPERVAHALTSTVAFVGERVLKIYNPGFVPRFLYWLSFQAPFGYQYNRLALEAAVLRRRLAGELTAYWYGENLVTPALGVEEVGGHLALVSAFVAGCEPHDHHHARAFLFDLAARFDAAGLPTWQIDPRQPRSLGNLIETAPGRYVVIDLESGVVSPLASPRAWWRAIRRSLVPFYDDVYFDITKAYLAREAPAILAARGDAFLERLEATVAEAEAAATAWHRSEPRFWSRAMHALWSAGTLPRRARAAMATGRERAEAWLEAAIDGWAAESRLTPAEAERARIALRSPGVQAVLPHFGVHLVIGVALRFPLGSIARVSYVLANLLGAFILFALRRRTATEFRRSLGIHSPLVLLAAAMPGVGTFSYLLSWPLLRNFLLVRIGLDAVGMKLPFRIYARLGFRRLIAKRPRAAPPGPLSSAAGPNPASR